MLQSGRHDVASEGEDAKKLVSLIAVAVALTAGISYAPDNKQQSKMGECNKEAGEEVRRGNTAAGEDEGVQRRGQGHEWADRKKFMSECVKKQG